jgi:hypothetical protein
MQTFIWLGSETAKRRFMNVFIASTTSSPALLVKSCKMLKQCQSKIEGESVTHYNNKLDKLQSPPPPPPPP